MKKVTFELDLDEIEDKDALTTFTNWGDFFYSVWELKHNMHNKFKHKDWNDGQWRAYNEIKEWMEDEFEKPFKLID